MRSLSGKHIAILVDNYFEQAEFEEPLRALKDAGAEVTVISTKEMKLQGLNHVDKGDKFEADLLLDQADWVDYDALVLPGGAINADSLRVNEDAKQMVIEFMESGKPVAAICHAPWLLVSADLVEGRKLTSYHTIQDDIINAGGEWVDMPVVIDGNLITSRQPDDIPQFNQAISDLLEEQDTNAVDEGADTIIGETETETEVISRGRSMGLEEDDIISRQDMQDLDDPDVLQPSSLGPNEERTDTY
jgi:protease I